MSLRLAKFFGMSYKFWIHLRNDASIIGKVRISSLKSTDKMISVFARRGLLRESLNSDIGRACAYVRNQRRYSDQTFKSL